MDPYIPRKEVDASYRPKSNLMSPGLKRAREPYRIRNAITGILVAAFGVGVWAYSISAVKQDAFDDVDEEARVLAAARQAAPKAAPQAVTPPPKEDAGRVDDGLGTRRGLLVKMLHSKMFDPTGKTLVWGAPNVDNIGTMWERK